MIELSKLSNRYISHPSESFSLNKQFSQIQVINFDLKQQGVSWSLMVVTLYVLSE